MKTKEQILLENGHEKKGKYYLHTNLKALFTLDDAWELFADDYCDDNNLDLTDEEIIKRLS